MSKKINIEVILTCQECNYQWGDLIVKEVEDTHYDKEKELDCIDEIDIELKRNNDDFNSHEYDDFEDNLEDIGDDNEDKDDDVEFFCPNCGSSKLLFDEVR